MDSSSSNNQRSHFSNMALSAQPKKSGFAAFAQPFVCSGIAACFASLCIHPIDLAKVRLQLFAVQNPGKARPSFIGILSKMIARDGVASIYAGLSASLLRQAIYGTARMGLHRTISDYLTEKNGGKPINFFQKAGSSMLGGAIAVSIGTPLDVALVRMQADTMKPAADRNGYRNAVDALYRIAKEEGFGALYKGLAPNIARGMSMNVGMMACSDQAKEVMLKITGDDPKHPGLGTRLGAAAAGGFFAAWLSLPFDMLKSRLQDVKRKPDGKLMYNGVVGAAQHIFRKEGPFAFWTGFGAYYARCAPHAMIILLTIDEVRHLYANAFMK